MAPLLGSATDITAILILIIAVFAIFDFQSFFTVQNFTQILINAALLLLIAVGATFVLITGGVDISVGSVLVFSGVIVGEVMQWFGSEGRGASIAAIAAALLACTAWGCVNGLVITKLAERVNAATELNSKFVENASPCLRSGCPRASTAGDDLDRARGGAFMGSDRWADGPFSRGFQPKFLLGYPDSNQQHNPNQP